MLVAASVQPGFDNANSLVFSHIAATQQGPAGVQLYEELNAGVPAMLSLTAWQRLFVPSSLRNSLFADTATSLIDFCLKNVADPTFASLGPSPACAHVTPIVRAGCDKRIFGVGVLAGEPSSRGSVTRDSSGHLIVDVNYLDTDKDLQAFGAAARAGFRLVTSHTGPSAAQLPCTDKKNSTCMSLSCPDHIADYVNYTRSVLKIVKPAQAYKMTAAPASVVYPQFLEPALADPTNDDKAIGKLVKEQIFAAHHLAGSAAIGSVVNGSTFQVLGVLGLYAVDGSVLPTTPRANPMATIMALGHLAGLRAVGDMVK